MAKMKMRIKRRWPDARSTFLSELYSYFAIRANRDVAHIIMDVLWTSPNSVICLKHRLSIKVKENVGDPSFDRDIYAEAISFLALWQRGERFF